MAEPEFVVEGDLVVVKIDGVAQSAINPLDPTQLDFIYTERIADYLDAIDEPGVRYRVVHIGGAGMMLARYVAATRPTSPQIVLEPDEELTELVRLHVPLPERSGIKVRPRDGRLGLTQMPDDYARVIIVDAFDGASVPADLVSTEFFADVSRVLESDGLLIMNIIDQRPFDWARRVIAGITEIFGHFAVGTQPTIFNRPMFGNMIVAGSNAPLPIDAVRHASACAIWPHRILADFEVLKFVAGAQPFNDADAVRSPVAGATGNLRFT